MLNGASQQVIGVRAWAELCVRGAGGQPGLLWEKLLTGAPCLSLGGLLLHSSALTYNRALNLHLLSAVLALLLVNSLLRWKPGSNAKQC